MVAEYNRPFSQVIEADTAIATGRGTRQCLLHPFHFMRSTHK